MGAIAESLAEHGQYAPIVIRPDGTILAGAHRWSAAKALGWERIWCAVVDVDEERARRIVLADNRTSDLAAYDDAALADLLRELPDLDGTGYTGDDLDDLLAELDEVPVLGLDPESPYAGGDANITPEPSLTERLEDYRTKGVRSVIMDYPVDRYEWVTRAMGAERDRRGVDTNADLLVELLAETQGRPE